MKIAFYLSTGINIWSMYAPGNESGKDIDPITGNVVTDANYTLSDYLPTSALSKIVFSDSSNLVFYDKDLNFLEGVLSDADENNIVPKKSKWFRFSVENTIASTFFVDEYRRTFPNHESGPTKIFQKESNQNFFRESLDGKLTYLRNDFDYINDKPITTEFITEVESSVNGIDWVTEFKGRFFKTDCKIDEDRKSLVVTPDPLDEYVKVLAGMEKEFNLIKLLPEIQPLFLMKRPLIQIYVPGDNIVSSFIAGTYFEQEADVVTDKEKLVNDYLFAFCTALKEVNITVTGNNTAANALYVGRLTISGDEISGNLYPAVATGYRVYVNQVSTNDFLNFSQRLTQLVRISDNVVLYEKTEIAIGNYDSDDITLDAKSGSGATGTALAETFTYNIYARYLLDVETINGLETYPLPADDIVADNNNYRRAIGYAIDVAYISMNFSTTPTEWGLSDNGQYFMPPASFFGDTFFPIAKSTWRYASIWFAFASFDWMTEEYGRKSYLLRDAFPVSSVISVLLKEIAPEITHEATVDYSQFLYDTINPITFQQLKLLITPKSNLIAGNYDKAAQKANTTLSQILNMLRTTMRLYWHIENGKLRIEHISWYNNGGSYSAPHTVETDTTVLMNVRNVLPWSFDTNKLDYDKMDMPERYQFKWMDEVTPSFTGFPIEVLSPFVTPGKIEDITVSNFTTDIDYILMNPGGVSKDGFALFGAVQANALKDKAIYFPLVTSGTGETVSDPFMNLKTAMQGKQGVLRINVTSDANGLIAVRYYDVNDNFIMFGSGTVVGAGTTPFSFNEIIPDGAAKFAFGITPAGVTISIEIIDFLIADSYELPFVSREVGGFENQMQNGYMSWLTLHPNYYTYDLPASNVLINDEPGVVFGVERRKKQTLEFPLSIDPNPMKLIKTEIGDGQVEKIELNLQTRMSKTTLKHDTE